LPSVQNHDFFLQYAVQTERSIGELKTSLEALNKSFERQVESQDKVSAKQADKLEKVLEELHEARGAFAAIKWIGGILGTLIFLVVSTALTVLLKHFKLI